MCRGLDSHRRDCPLDRLPLLHVGFQRNRGKGVNVRGLGLSQVILAKVFASDKKSPGSLQAKTKFCVSVTSLS